MTVSSLKSTSSRIFGGGGGDIGSVGGSSSAIGREQGRGCIRGWSIIPQVPEYYRLMY